MEDSIEKVSFPELKKLKMVIMPVICAAWEVIHSFNCKFFDWWKVPFPHLKVDEIEECNIDWTRKLDYVSKD
jgi:hypothetical protein